MRGRRGGQQMWVAAAVLTGLLLSLASWSRTHSASTDSFEYMRGGQTLWSGQGFKSMSGDPQLFFPPFYPILIGAGDRILHSPVVAGRLVSLAASVASIFLLYLLARALSPGLPAVVAAWLFALLPLRVMMSTMVWSENTYCLLILGGALLWVASRSRLAAAFPSGLTLGAAYLTRPEGIVPFGILALGSLLPSQRQEGRATSPWLRACLLVAGFAVISLPYFVFLHQNTGRWQFSTKTHRTVVFSQTVTRGIPVAATQRLSADNKTLSFARQEETLPAAAKRVCKNGRDELLGLARAVSPFLLIGVVLSFSLPWWRRTPAAIWFALAALACHMALILAFHVMERFLLVPALLPVLLFVPALGDAGQRLRKGSRDLRLTAAVALTACALLWMAWAMAPRLIVPRPPGLKAGPLLAAIRQTKDAPGPIVGNGRPARLTAFYTGRDFERLPWESLDRVLAYARHHHADFLLVTTSDHPELAALAATPRETKDLTPLARIQRGAPPRREIIQLYRLRPLESTGGRGR